MEVLIDTDGNVISKETANNDSDDDDDEDDHDDD